MPHRPKFLMCPPAFFNVTDFASPWMDGSVHRVSPGLARLQWEGLRHRLAARAVIETLPALDNLPDLPFTANAGFVFEDTVVLSRFRNPERRHEELHLENWFDGFGLELIRLPDGVYFEGAGDALLDRLEPRLWAGYGPRTSIEAHGYLARWLDLDVVSLRLADPAFVHLDTCLCPLADGYLMYHPDAFDEASRRLIECRVPENRRILVGIEDVRRFACNAINIGREVFLNHASISLRAQLTQAGFMVHATPLSEFIKGGGGARGLTLRLNETRPTGVTSAACVEVA